MLLPIGHLIALVAVGRAFRVELPGQKSNGLGYTAMDSRKCKRTFVDNSFQRIEEERWACNERRLVLLVILTDNNSQAVERSRNYADNP